MAEKQNKRSKGKKRGNLRHKNIVPKAHGSAALERGLEGRWRRFGVDESRRSLRSVPQRKAHACDRQGRIFFPGNLEQFNLKYCISIGAEPVAFLSYILK